MANIHEHHKGRRVVVREGVKRNYLPADFPGWGAPDALERLAPMADIAGMVGVISSVESHGSNPWTRYSVTFGNGGSASGLILGEDIDLLA